MEQAWMIEKKGALLWWNGKPKKYGLAAWSVAIDGIRFARKFDAEICAIAQGYSLSSVMATEHQWV